MVYCDNEKCYWEDFGDCCRWRNEAAIERTPDGHCAGFEPKKNEDEDEEDEVE